LVINVGTFIAAMTPAILAVDRQAISFRSRTNSGMALPGWSHG
jgi:hypothetical protein